MKIALVNTITPFIRGGAEILVDDLFDQLQQRGHRVTLFRLPFPNEYEVQLQELVLAGKLLDFTSYDRVIAFKFPAYCVCHPHKVLWLFHQFRQVYDLWKTSEGLDIQALRQLICNIDSRDIANSQAVFVIGDEVKDRLYQYNKINSELIYPPLPNQVDYYCAASSDYIYYPSRVTKLKRQHLAIEAMRFVKSNAKLVLTGECNDSGYERALTDLIKKYNLQEKVDYKNVWLDKEEKIKKIAESMAVLFIPYKEDYGYVTLEAFYASKPLITCTDSGSPVKFLADGKNGYIADPTPESIAEKIDMIYENKEKTRKMGEYAYESILRKEISWDETVRRLLQ